MEPEVAERFEQEEDKSYYRATWENLVVSLNPQVGPSMTSKGTEKSVKKAEGRKEMLYEM